MTKITAHRGYSKKYPENTLIALQEAVTLGTDRIEQDVHFTKDRQLVVHHDYSLGHPDNGDVAHCRLEILSEPFVEKLHTLGIKVHAADCNTEDELQKAFSLHVDRLSTNDLALALTVVNEYKSSI